MRPREFTLVRTRVMRGWLCEARTSDNKIIRPIESGAFWIADVVAFEHEMMASLAAEGYRYAGTLHPRRPWIDTVDHDDPRLRETADAA